MEYVINGNVNMNINNKKTNSKKMKTNNKKTNNKKMNNTKTNRTKTNSTRGFISINNQEIPYCIYRQYRKTLAMSFSEEGILEIKMPYFYQLQNVLEFIKKKENWIVKQYNRIQNQQEHKIVICKNEYNEYLKKAHEILNRKVAYYSRIIGVSYNRVTIRNQKTRWGSCSSKGNINLNWKLVLMPEEIQDYVVIHELCHLIEMNHSRQFWNCVERYCKNYELCRKWLRENVTDISIEGK